MQCELDAACAPLCARGPAFAQNDHPRQRRQQQHTQTPGSCMQAVVVGGECKIPSPPVQRATGMAPDAFGLDAAPPGEAEALSPQGPGLAAGPEQGPGSMPTVPARESDGPAGVGAGDAGRSDADEAGDSESAAAEESAGSGEDGGDVGGEEGDVGAETGEEGGTSEDGTTRDGAAAFADVQRQVEAADSGPARGGARWVGCCVGVLAAWTVAA